MRVSGVDLRSEGRGGAGSCGRQCPSTPRLASREARSAASRGGAVARAAAGNVDGPRDGGALAVASAAAEHDDPVGQLEGLVDVVGDQQHRGGLGLVDVQEQVLHLHPGQGVQRAERLVEQQDAGVAGQGPGQRGALGHAAGDLAGPVLGEAVQAHELQQLGHLGLAFLGAAARGQADGDVGLQRVPRQQPRFLEREGAAGIDAVDRRAVDEDGAGAGGVQARCCAQERGLAAAARAQDGEDLAGGDVEGRRRAGRCGRRRPVPKVRRRPRKDTGRAEAEEEPVVLARHAAEDRTAVMGSLHRSWQ